MTEFSNANLVAIYPEIFLAISALFLLILGAFKGNEFSPKQTRLAMLSLFVTAGLVFYTPDENVIIFTGQLLTNGFTKFCKILILGGSFVALYLSLGRYRENKEKRVCEFSVLVLLATLGMLFMVSANGFLSLYVGLELQSLALYVLAAIHRDDAKSSEAGLKYFVLGALSSGIILYGISLIYGFTGTVGFVQIRELYAAGGDLPVGALVGLVFLFAGICFKISAVPFHMWTPDVYEGSPMSVTAFFAVAPKIASIALFVRLALEPFSAFSDQWQQIIIFVSAASMVIGSLGAIQQTNIKRLIAYSSIGHVGFILLGLAAASEEGVKGILIYILIYATLSLGIFACIMMVNRRDGRSDDISTFSGLSKTKPVLAFAIAVIMFSMAGIPPFAGFFGKFFVILAAIQSELYVLSVIAVVSSVIAAFYYLKIVKIMYLDESVVPLDTALQPEHKHVAFVATVFNIFFVLGFTPIMVYAEEAAKWVFLR